MITNRFPFFFKRKAAAGAAPFVAVATEFTIPGGDYLSRADLGADAPGITLSLWFKVNSFGAGFCILIAPSAGSPISFQINISSPTHGTISFQVGDTNGNSQVSWASGAVNRGQWYNLLCSVDLSIGGAGRPRWLYLSDTLIAPTSNAGNNPELVGFNTGYKLASFSAGFAAFDGCMAEFWVDDVVTDLSVEANRRLWIGADGKPIFLGTQGEQPTGSPPRMYLSGDGIDFAINRAGTLPDWTVNGAPVACADAP